MTTIVAVKTDKEIVVGADSKVSWIKETFRETDCKIHQVGNVFFALAGIAGDAGTGFSVARIATQAIKNNQTIQDAVVEFVAMIQDPIYSYVKSMKFQMPDWYNGNYGNGSFMDIVFFGFENGEPEMYYLNCWPDNLDAKGFKPGFSFIFLGCWKSLSELVETQPDYWDMGIIKATCNLIQLAINDYPQHVGPPINIVRITADGAEWIQKSSGCPELKAY
jgi:hypothetical protein